MHRGSIERAEGDIPIRRPRPFAEQPIKRGRARPKKAAPLHLEWGSEPAGAA
jgi:hypothetical protein